MLRVKISVSQEVKDNAKWRLGDVIVDNSYRRKILMKLISVEIKRKVKVENVNLAAKKRSEWIVNHWDLVERRSEPLHPLHKEGPY